MKNIKFIKNTIYEFEYNKFNIIFDGLSWFAESLDPNIDQEIIIIEDEFYKLEDKIELFDNYVFFKTEFEKLKNLVSNNKE